MVIVLPSQPVLLLWKAIEQTRMIRLVYHKNFAFSSRAITESSAARSSHSASGRRLQYSLLPNWILNEDE